MFMHIIKLHIYFQCRTGKPFFACNKMLGYLEWIIHVLPFSYKLTFEKTSIEEKKYATQHQTVFLLFKQQLLFMVIKKTGKWPSKGPLWYCRNVSNASWLNLFLCIECFLGFSHSGLLAIQWVRSNPLIHSTPLPQTITPPFHFIWYFLKDPFH